MTNSLKEATKKFLPSITIAVGLMALVLTVQIFNQRIDFVESPYRTKWIKQTRGIASVEEANIQDLAKDKAFLSGIAQANGRPMAQAGDKPDSVNKFIFAELANSYAIEMLDGKIAGLVSRFGQSSLALKRLENVLAQREQIFPVTYYSTKNHQEGSKQIIELQNADGATQGRLVVSINNENQVLGLKFEKF